MKSRVRRWVVLEHRVGRGFDRPGDDTVGDHWDWMLEWDDGPLWTWSTMTLDLPLGSAGRIVAQRLPDHRRRYLDYQGRLSENRGTLSRLVQGTVRSAIQDSLGNIRVRLECRDRGRFWSPPKRRDKTGSTPPVTCIDWQVTPGESAELTWRVKIADLAIHPSPDGRDTE